MADFDSSLPVRSEADGTDERLHVKIVDESTPSQMATVDTDKNLHVEIHGHKPDDATDIVMKLSEKGEPNPNGYYDVSNNSDPASIGLIGHDRQASPADTYQILRLTAIGGESDSVCLDIALHDEVGNYYDEDNPLPVTVTESEGVEVHDYDTAAAIAKDATDDHTYSVADGDVFLLYGVLGNASGKMKIELQIGDGDVAELFDSKCVRFNSTASTEADIDFLNKPIKITGTVNTTTIKIIRTNLDNQAQDLYTTIIGVTKP